MKNYIFTSESVGEGHPDKVCDRISDAIVDAYLAEEPESRCAIECLATTNRVIIAGEVRGPEAVLKKIEGVTRAAIKDIGYEQDEFHWNKVQIEVLVHKQSIDIAKGVDSGHNKEEGAGDQGIMFGYACRETEALMPAAIHYAHKIVKALADARHSGAVKFFGPDAKSQVSLEYKDGKPVRAHSIVVSTQHTPEVSQKEIRETVRKYVLDVLPKGWMCGEDHFYTNPTGSFIIGGPDGDCGLTGRKIIVDSYGGSAPHGGGAFSGKDPTKVDRSGAYAARYLAKNVVASGLADRCTVQLAYAIGIARPLAVYVNNHGTSQIAEEKIAAKLQQLMDLSPKGIRTHLGMNRPIYARTAAYGHFGREPEKDGGFSWERLDLADELRRLAGGQKTAAV